MVAHATQEEDSPIDLDLEMSKDSESKHQKSCAPAAEKIERGSSSQESATPVERRGARLKEWPEAEGLAVDFGLWSDFFLESGEVMRVLTSSLIFD